MPCRFTSTLAVEVLVGDMRRRGQRRGVGGAVHGQVEPAPALVDRQAEPLQPALVGQRQRHQRRRRPAGGLDRVGEVLEAADGAGQGDHLGAAGAERPGDRVAEAAAGAGDQRHRAGASFTPWP